MPVGAGFRSVGISTTSWPTLEEMEEGQLIIFPERAILEKGEWREISKGKASQENLRRHGFWSFPDGSCVAEVFYAALIQCKRETEEEEAEDQAGNDWDLGSPIGGEILQSVREGPPVHGSRGETWDLGDELEIIKRAKPKAIQGKRPLRCNQKGRR